jgi:hypothetical protein
MKTLFVVLLAICCLGSAAPAGGPLDKSEKVCQRRPFRVVVYPFIPRYKETLYYIKSQFESENPQIELKLIDLSSNYYAATDKEGKPACCTTRSPRHLALSPLGFR